MTEFHHNHQESRRGGTLPAVLLLVVLTGCSPKRADVRGPTSPARDSLRAHVEAMAGDAMGGRGLDEPGLQRATEYAAAVLEYAGAEPGFRPDNGPTSFLQPVPLIQYRYGPGNRLVIRGPNGSRTLRHGEEMIILTPGSETRRVSSAPPVFVGYGLSEPDMGWDDYEKVEALGRLAFILDDARSGLPPELRAVYNDPVQGPKRLAEAAEDHGVKGVIVVPEAGTFDYWDALLTTRKDGIFVPGQAYTVAAPDDPPFPVVLLRREVLTELFRGAEYDPVMRTGAYGSFELPQIQMGLDLDVTTARTTSHNLVGLVPGSDPALARELVVVSAHIDHLGTVNGEIYNGANDDASGCAIVLEAARRLAAEPTPRPVLFTLFTAEETDHLGSIHFLDELPLSGFEVAYSLNLEHMGRSGDGMLLATASTELVGLTRSVADDPSVHRLRVNPLETPQTIQGSDSFSFLLHQIPLVIVGGGMFPEYHSPADDPGLIDYELLEDGLELVEKLIRRLASQ